MKPSMRPIHIPLSPCYTRGTISVSLEGPSRARRTISASLEATPWHKGQTAPPPNHSPYGGIKGQPLHHGSKDGRRQAATPTVNVTGVPSADSGHRSAILDAVAAPWDLRRGTKQARYSSRRPSGPASHQEGGVRRRHVSPGPSSVHACTPTRGPGPSRAITTAGTLQDERRSPHRTKDEIQDDSDARRLPTVYLLQYPPTVPRNLGEDDDFHAPLICPAPSCNYKRRRRVSFRLSGLDSGLDINLLGPSDFSPKEDAQGPLSTHPHRLHS